VKRGVVTEKGVEEDDNCLIAFSPSTRKRVFLFPSLSLSLSLFS